MRELPMQASSIFAREIVSDKEPYYALDFEADFFYY